VLGNPNVPPALSPITFAKTTIHHHYLLPVNIQMIRFLVKYIRKQRFGVCLFMQIW
jgi:hypothetical protein